MVPVMSGTTYIRFYPLAAHIDGREPSEDAVRHTPWTPITPRGPRPARHGPEEGPSGAARGPGGAAG